MPVDDNWSGANRRTDADRRKILERRRQERIAAADAAADAIAAAAGLSPPPPPGPARGGDRRGAGRRQAQICFVCHSPFEPKSNGQVICPDCQMDGVRGGPGSGRKGARF